MDREQFDELFEEVVDLPTLDVTLQVDLPRLLSPELERLRMAIDEDAYGLHAPFLAAGAVLAVPALLALPLLATQRSPAHPAESLT